MCCALYITTNEAVYADFESSIEGADYNYFRVLISSLVATIIGGSALGSLEVLIFSKVLRRKPFGISLVIKTLVYILFIIIFFHLLLFMHIALRLKNHFFTMKF